MSINVYVPVSSKLRNRFFVHSGDTFRELVKCWEQSGLVTIHDAENTGYVWIGTPDQPDSVLLYDRPTQEWWDMSPPQAYKLALFGNDVPKSVPRAFPWIFWGRRPQLLETDSALLHKTSFKSRPVKCVFIGKIENNVQQHYRDPRGWSTVVDHFKLVVGAATKYPYDQKEYLYHLSQARYGLCLRGYGPKCNREIELMAMGTVPIVTPDVDISQYFDPPRLGVHYFIANAPSDMIRIVAETTETQWTEMSNKCRDWYLRNCSTIGSFYQTMRLISTLASSVLQSTSIRNSKSLPVLPLPGIRRVVIDTVFFERTFSGISRVWLGLLWSLSERVNELWTNDKIEIVLLLRAQAKDIPSELLQRFAFIGVESFNYSRSDQDVQMLNTICSSIKTDLFISTYYTWCTSVPNLLMVHDMIPERFRFQIDAMWKQKTEAIQNASEFICVSECTKRDLMSYAKIEEQRCHVVTNSFDASAFQAIDDVSPEYAAHTLEATLNLRQPFILVIAGNANAYKNTRLVIDAIRMRPTAFRGHTTVILADQSVVLPHGLPSPVKLISKVTNEQLGMMYQLAAAMIYPSRWEGFGLPILEAYWFECPVICCERAGAVPDVAGDGAWLIGADRPDELCRIVQHIITHDETVSGVRRKKAIGLERLNEFSATKQLNAFRACISYVLKTKKQLISHTSMSSSSNTLPSTTVTPVPTTPADVPTTPSEAPAAPATPSLPPKPFHGIHLIVQYFQTTDADRQDEFDYCVKANLENPSIAKIHCLVEADTKVPDWLSSHAKYVEFRVITRLTYRMAFDYANRVLAGQVCAIANLDIFLDQTSKWDTLPSLFDMSIVLCLARHEFDGESSTKDKGLQNLAYATAQDCWVFQSPVFVKDCDFALGKLGCDNAIAHRFRISGYIPVNAQDDYKVHHLDICRAKNGGKIVLPNPEMPEERGYRLLPSYGAVQSVDKLLDDLKLGDVHKYLIICDIMSNFMRLTNPRAEQAPAAAATPEK